MKTATGLLLSLSIATFAAAQETPPKNGELKDPVEILKKADAATRKVDTVRYAASFNERRAGRSLDLSGTVVQGGESEDGYAKFRIEFKAPAADGSGEPPGFTLGCDGRKCYLIDAKAKTVTVGDRKMLEASPGGAGLNLLMREYSHPSPFGDEINAKKAELKEPENVGGEKCCQIHVAYAGITQTTATWFISQKDFLPRRVDRALQTAAGTRLTLSELAVDPRFVEDPFKLVVPEGYERKGEKDADKDKP